MLQQQQQPSIPMPAKGWLLRLKHWIVGEQDPIEQQMREIARQGLGMVRLAHIMGTIMIVAFSLGSAVGICSTLIDSITKAGLFTWAAIPFDIAFVVSVLLVICCDVASVCASFMVRLLRSRYAPKGDYTWHVSIIVLACVLESGTFGYMSWKYDDPAVLVVAVLIIVRAVGSPVVALYLNMMRQIPISPSDISYHNFLASGKGVIRDVVHLANDASASLQDKIELYGASYAMRPHEEKQFARLMAAAEKRQARLAVPPRALPPRIVAASATLPEVEPQVHYNAQAMHDWDETDYDSADEIIDDEVEVGAEDFSTRILPAIHTATRETKQVGRDRADSGPAKRNGSKIAPGLRKANAQLRAEAKRIRRGRIRDATYAVLDEWFAAGAGASLSDRELARRVAGRVDFDVNPSGNTVARWRGPWQSSRAHKAAILATDLGDVPPMEPQELRELQEVW